MNFQKQLAQWKALLRKRSPLYYTKNLRIGDEVGDFTVLYIHDRKRRLFNLRCGCGQRLSLSEYYLQRTGCCMNCYKKDVGNIYKYLAAKAK